MSFERIGELTQYIFCPEMRYRMAIALSEPVIDLEFLTKRIEEDGFVVSHYGEFCYDGHTKEVFVLGLMAGNGDSSLCGVIYDRYGKSNIEGVLTENMVRFTKKYDDDSSPVEYIGTRTKNEDFEGVWAFVSERTKCINVGTFKLTKQKERFK